MDKAFDPAAVEPRWRQRWEELAVGHADASSSRATFTIALPPPNITGVLHLGHAAGFSIQDSLARHRRMNGYEVEWCPGTDHAAIATNAVIERQLAAEGRTKEDLGRDAFLARVDAWYAEYGGRIYEQMRRLGFTCDWARARFTLDEPYVRAIRQEFKSLYDEGLIYRGPRLVNWCPHCRSAISDEEIEWQEHADTLTRLRYPVEDGSYITVATVRPETMLGDTAVAVAPGDARYAHLVGKTVVLPLVGRRIPIIEDASVKPEFGTGALKVTPGHDPTDYEIGHRHDLPSITVVAPDGTIDFAELPTFHRMPVHEAREAITAALAGLGAVEGQAPYVHDVGHCDRCHHVLEPLISAQWWVRMESLAAPAIAAVESEEIRFHPVRYGDGYLAWMGSIRDWCISRQIWLGHSIPVSTCANGHRFAWVDEPSACPICHSQELTADPDVLDTWFSSALWPFAIFGWPEATVDLSRFYPTDVLVTDRGIIPLWVARMIMTGLKFVGTKPFSDVLITSTIQAADGSRMNKSRGNAVDPLIMIERFGADAVRAWAAAVGTSGQDVRFDINRIESFQRFANKLWNVTRFLLTRLGDGGDLMATVSEPAPASLQPEDRWMLAHLGAAIGGCDSAIGAYRFHEVMDRLYDIVWHTFCDRYVEMIKPRLRPDAPVVSQAAAAWTAVTALDVLLRLLHPFMPFVTEECAQRLPDAAPTLQYRTWPIVPEWWMAAETSAERAAIDDLLELVQRIRAVRQDHGVPAASPQRHPAVLRVRRGGLDHRDASRLLRVLAPLEPAEHPEGDWRDLNATPVVGNGIDVDLYLDGGIDDRHRDGRSTGRRRQELEDRIARLEARLANPNFVERARPEVVTEARRRLAEAREQHAALRVPGPGPGPGPGTGPGTGTA